MTGVAIVTGGGRGIGAAVSARLAGLGFDVAVGYRSDRASAEQVADECRAAGSRALALPVDVADEEAVLGLFTAVDRQLGPVTALVNNAGIVAAKSPLTDMTAGRIRRMMDVNVVGALLCAREAVRRMSTAHGGGGGVVVNISSAASRVGSPGEYVDYAASKGAIDTFTLGLSKELAREGVRVNAVRPGIIDTEIHASGGQPDRVARVAPLVPMGRAGRPDEVAAAVAWLCTEEASYVTGAIIDVSGGR